MKRVQWLWRRIWVPQYLIFWAVLPGWAADIPDPNKTFLRGLSWARLPTSTLRKSDGKRQGTFEPMRLTAAGEAASTFPATKMKIVGKIAKASSAQTVTRTSFCSLDTPEAWGKNHLHRKLPFAFLRRLGSHFSVLHWSTVPCLWAFQKHPLLPTGSAWSPRECAGLIWAPGVTGDSIQALERNNCSAQLKEKNILRTKTCTFQPKSGTRDLGGRTQDNKATEYMRCALQCSFQAEHLGKREGLLCHHCFLWWENLGAGGTTGWD